MDFLKRHYEKLVLAIALLVLIGTAGYLAKKVNQLRQQVQDAPLRLPTKGKPVRPVVMDAYQRELARLKSPVLWTIPAASMFPNNPVPITNTGTITNRPERLKPDIALRQVIREAFRLRFDAYTWDAAKKEAHAFQINFPLRRRTYFVENLGQPVPEPGETNRYVLVKFEKKSALVAVASMDPIERDVSELTIQRAGDEPILLVLGRITEPNPEALVQCGTDPQQQRLRSGGVFECNSRTYKVVDIAPTQMVIEDLKNGEKLIIPLTP
jgi:hypothetical protein